MKKLLFTAICIFMLSSCSADTSMSDTGEFYQLHELDNHQDASIPLCTEESIYFYEITENEKLDNTVFTLYEQNMKDNSVRLSGTIDGFYMTAGSSVLLEDGLAFTVCTKEGDELTNCLYCYTDGTLSRVYTWDSNIPMSYISRISEKELALFYPCSEARDGEEAYIYRILRVNLTEHTGEEIARFRYNITEGEGEIVPAVDYGNGLFHIFVKSVQGSGSSYSICSLDADGEKTAEYSIDLEDFLYLEPVSSYDSVYRIRRLEGGLFVLQTINSRVIIFEETDGRLVQVDAPECLRAFPEGYKIAESCGGHPGEIYFVNMFQDHLIKFDTFSGQFTESRIEKEDDESYIKSVYINPDGRILVNMDGYFYMKKFF